MGILEKIKTIFASGDEKEDERIKDNPESYPGPEEEEAEGELEELLRREYELKMQGDYLACLRIWNDYVGDNPELSPLGQIRRAKVQILRQDKDEAEKELLRFIDWYTDQGKMDYQGNYFAVFISALQDLGYLNGRWPDKEEYLANLSGEDIKLERSRTMARIKTGLKVLEARDCWSQALEEIRNNMDLIK